MRASLLRHSPLPRLLVLAAAFAALTVLLVSDGAPPATAQGQTIDVTISASPQQISAGQVANVTVTLSEAAPGWVFVNLTQPGATGDFLTNAPTSLYYNAGETSKSFGIRASSTVSAATKTISIGSILKEAGVGAVQKGDPSSVTIYKAARVIQPVELSGDVLVSTIGQPALPNVFMPLRGISGGQTVDFSVAQGFTTGSHAPGYTLSGIEVRMEIAGTASADSVSQNYRAELWSAATGGEPGSRLVRLTNPPEAAPVNDFRLGFKAPADTRLAANTKYFLVLYRTDSTSDRLRLPRSRAEDSGGAAGWSIEDEAYRIASAPPSGSWARASGTNNLVMRVKGTEAPASAAAWSATLTPQSFGGFLGCDNAQVSLPTSAPPRRRCRTTISPSGQPHTPFTKSSWAVETSDSASIPTAPAGSAAGR